jgi:hypothetical protein
MLRDVPPLVPSELKLELAHAIEEIKNNTKCSPKQSEEYNLLRLTIEDAIIEFGKELWPYRQAFKFFLQDVRHRLAEEYFVLHLDKPMKQWFLICKEHNCTLSELKNGSDSAIIHLSPEERNKIRHAFVETDINTRNAAAQEVLGLRREEYEKKISEFKMLQEDIIQHLDYLKQLAQNEKKHPSVAYELHALIREFELALCGLRPDNYLDQLHRVEEYIEGRKQEQLQYN